MCIAIIPGHGVETGCGICYETFDDTVKTVSHVAGLAHHAFHEICLQKWAKTRPVCPICMQEIKLGSMRVEPFRDESGPFSSESIEACKTVLMIVLFVSYGSWQFR